MQSIEAVRRNACEHCLLTAPQGQRFCSASCQECELADFEGNGCAMLCDTTKGDVHRDG